MHRRGASKTNIIATLVCGVIMYVVFSTIIPFTTNVMRVNKDQSQLEEIYSCFSLYGRFESFDMRFPIPGHIDSIPDKNNPLGVNFPLEVGVVSFDGGPRGRGRADDTINLTGWVHSFMIGAGYYNSNTLISANESNPLVVAKGDQLSNPLEIPYNYEVVGWENDDFDMFYWDPLFSGDISGLGRARGTVQGGVEGVCHVSYANMALCGERLKYWKSGDHRRVIMSSRGPQDSANIGADFTKSPTLKLYGDSTKWAGVYVAGDGATQYVESMFFDGNYTPIGKSASLPDNAFSAEFTDYENTDSLGNVGSASADTWMVLNVGSTATDVLPAWDTLLP